MLVSVPISQQQQQQQHGASAPQEFQPYQDHSASESNPLSLRNDVSSHPHLWNSSKTTTIPLWMKDYMEWHSSIKSNLRELWKNETTRPPLMILQCLDSDRVCGGTADRLKPIPLVLLAASKQPRRRLFLIQWKGRPCKLEEFLVPPPGGLDWTVPDWLDQELIAENTNHVPPKRLGDVHHFLTQAEKFQNLPILTAKIQWHNGGETVYENDRQTTTKGEFQRIYHDLFRILFTPVKPIQDRLQHIWGTTNNYSLQPGQYAAAHYRALYWEEQPIPSVEDQQITAINAVHCASQLRPGFPIYFASDSSVAAAAIKQYVIDTKRPVVVVDHPGELLHMDRVQVGNGTKVEDLYPIFVDLYLMGNANCISHGDGGFGRYGLMLSSNPTCASRHIFRHQRKSCKWKDA
jgi:hypothetical protein